MPADPRDSDLEYFRLRARAWLLAHAREESELTQDQPAYWAEARRFQRIQREAGFSGIAWASNYGGQGLTDMHQAVFNDEAAAYALPSDGFQITLAILGMTMLEHGTEGQKKRYLPEMLNGNALWVQLLSEPNAGSDLAAARMRAEQDGEEWVLNGEKVWSSFAQWSDYAMVLARTDWDVPKHAGLTMFVMPLESRGLTILPLRQMSGDEEFCQEFLDSVRVPAWDVLGGVGRGWAVASSMFKYSKLMTSGAGLTGPVFAKDRGGDPDPGRDLIDFVNEAGLGGDAHVRRLVADVVAENVVSGLLAKRVSSDPNSNAAASTMAKLLGSLVVQRRCAVDLELRAELAVAWNMGDDVGASPLFQYLKGRTASVAGGTHEVMMNGIGEGMLGLPREPTQDKGVPFRDIISAAR